MRKKKSAGVSFDQKILDFLDELSEETGLSRSIVINLIIENYAGERQQPGIEDMATKSLKRVK